MTNEEFNKKWNKSAYAQTEHDNNKLIEYVNDCFDMYETEGFCDTFESPYKQYARYNGLAFKVIERCTQDDFDLTALPAWEIELETGGRMTALPEEICKIERRK